MPTCLDLQAVRSEADALLLNLERTEPERGEHGPS